MSSQQSNISIHSLQLLFEPISIEITGYSGTSNKKFRKYTQHLRIQLERPITEKKRGTRLIRCAGSGVMLAGVGECTHRNGSGSHCAWVCGCRASWPPNSSCRCCCPSSRRIPGDWWSRPVQAGRLFMQQQRQIRRHKAFQRPTRRLRHFPLLSFAFIFPYTGVTHYYTLTHFFADFFK